MGRRNVHLRQTFNEPKTTIDPSRRQIVLWSSKHLNTSVFLFTPGRRCTQNAPVCRSDCDELTRTRNSVSSCATLPWKKMWKECTDAWRHHICWSMTESHWGVHGNGPHKISIIDIANSLYSEKMRFTFEWTYYNSQLVADVTTVPEVGICTTKKTKLALPSNTLQVSSSITETNKNWKVTSNSVFSCFPLITWLMPSISGVKTDAFLVTYESRTAM